MNKKEFMEYIEKLPENAEFTSMDKGINFDHPLEGNPFYTEIDVIEMKYSSSTNQHSIFDPEKNKIIIRNDISSSEEKLFLEKVCELREKLESIFQNDHGSIKQWGDIPIYTIATLLEEYLELNNNMEHWNSLSPPTRYLLRHIYLCLLDKNNQKEFLISECA